MNEEASHKANAHFQTTLGTVPASVATLARHAPGALDGYLALREFAHLETPQGHLDPATRELLFISLDVAVGHVEGAKAHVEAGLKAGLTVEAITQALVITMMISGIHTWSEHGYQVVDYAARLAAEPQSL